MKLTAVFEAWHLGDGNYPPLKKGMPVNLSFELQPETIAKTDQRHQEEMKQLEDAEYEFCATVLKIYGGEERIVVVQMRDFRCYLSSFPSGELELKEGDIVCGHGRLLLDHYIWVEYLHTYEDPPDLFYNLKVKAIRAVRIPESFIHRSEKGYSHACSLKPSEYTSSNTSDVEKMEGESFAFYIVDFDSEGVETDKIRRTFL